MSANRRRILDEGIDLIARKGYSNVSQADIARKAGISAAAMAREFDSRGDWLVASYERLFERRLEQFKRIAATVPANRTPDDTINALLQTVVRGNGADPLFAASYDFFFMARNDPEASARMRATRRKWEARMAPVITSMFAADVPAAVRDTVATHVEAIGSTAVSNGLEALDPRVTDVPIMRVMLTV